MWIDRFFRREAVKAPIRRERFVRNFRWCLAVTLLTVLVSGSEGLAQQGRLARSAFADRSLLGTSATTQRAVFAPFAASTCVPLPCAPGSLDTAISVSNTLSAPPGIMEVLDLFPEREGTVQVYLWDTYGHLLTFETGVDSPGFGLSEQPGKEGFLVAGATWRVLLSEILDRVGYAQHEIDAEHQDGVFAGYLWIVGNFAGIQGTTNLTDFATFTQSLVLQPDLGSTFFDLDGNAGVPIVPPPSQP